MRPGTPPPQDRWCQTARCNDDDWTMQSHLSSNGLEKLQLNMTKDPVVLEREVNESSIGLPPEMNNLPGHT